MQINQRLKKIEDSLNEKYDAGQVVWDFTNTTTEQLIKLKSLIKAGDLTEAEGYTAELVGNGFLSRRVIARSSYEYQKPNQKDFRRSAEASRRNGK